jgi:hypothetical protein
MAYSKPEILAQNSKQGVYAAGCPANDRLPQCTDCERTS